VIRNPIDPLFEYEGRGWIMGSGGERIAPVSFHAAQSNNGQLQVEIEAAPQETVVDLIRRFKDNQAYQLQFKNQNAAVFVPKAYLTNHEFSIGHRGMKLRNISFLASELQVTFSKYEPNLPTLAVAGVTGLDLTHFVSRDLRLRTGELALGALNSRESHKELIKGIRRAGTNHITGLFSLKLSNDLVHLDLDALLEKVEMEFQKIAELTTLAQSTRHDIVFIEIRQQRPTQTGYRAVWRSHSAPRKASVGLSEPLIDGFSLPKYLETTIPRYTEEVREERGVRFAIEWLVDSVSGKTLEGKFLQAMTALELLKDRFLRLRGMEFALDQETFDHVYRELQKSASRTLRGLKVTPEVRKEVYATLRGIRRHPLGTAVMRMLSELELAMDETAQHLDAYIEARDTITHTGLARAPRDLREFWMMYTRLVSLIQKIILRNLGYVGSYRDRTRSFNLVTPKAPE